MGPRFTSDSGSPLSQYLNCIYDEQELIRGADVGELGDLTRGLLERSSHGPLFQLAYHAPRSPAEKLTASLDAHETLLKVSFALSQGDTSEHQFHAALNAAQNSVCSLLPFLKPAIAGDPPKTPAGKKATVNARMLDTMQKRPESMGWTARQWATHLKCSPASIANAHAWKSLGIVKVSEQLSRAKPKDRRRKR